MNREETLEVVARTLHMAADWYPFTDHAAELHEVAEAVERSDEDSLGMCCPVCEEVRCDDHCPLENIRG